MAKKQHYLITAAYELRRETRYMTAITDDPMEWIAVANDGPGYETYFLINQFPITAAQAKLYDGDMKGM